MSYVCLWSPAWSTAAASTTDTFDAELTAVLPALLAHAPRVVVDPTRRLWADARGLHAATLAEQLLDVLRVHGLLDVRAGTALTPIAAEVAATWAPAMRDAVMRSAAAGDVVVRQAPFITSVRPGRDRAFIADFLVDVLHPNDFLANLLDGTGIDTCGRLAALDAESVEIRLGTEGVDLWERARADDARWLFRTPLRLLPSASLEWTEYALRNSDRLLFVINSLLASICAALVEQGERARDLSIVFSLANRTQHVHPLRSSRPSADQKRWVRLIRDALEQLQLPDAVVGIAIRVESVTGNDGFQGDLFDRGFVTADAVETTLAQLADDHGELIVAPRASRHPLVDKRTRWVAEKPSVVAIPNETVYIPSEKAKLLPPVIPTLVIPSERAERASRGIYPGLDVHDRPVQSAAPTGSTHPTIVDPSTSRELRSRSARDDKGGSEFRSRSARDDKLARGDRSVPHLTLQLVDPPRSIAVNVIARRDHEIPIRYRDTEGWHTLVDVAGPDCVSGGQWDGAYAREYYRCVREDGTLVWIYRGKREEGRGKRDTDGWYFHGWWD